MRTSHCQNFPLWQKCFLFISECLYHLNSFLFKCFISCEPVCNTWQHIDKTRINGFSHLRNITIYNNLIYKFSSKEHFMFCHSLIIVPLHPTFEWSLFYWLRSFCVWCPFLINSWTFLSRTIVPFLLVHQKDCFTFELILRWIFCFIDENCSYHFRCASQGCYHTCVVLFDTRLLPSIRVLFCLIHDTLHPNDILKTTMLI